MAYRARNILIAVALAAVAALLTSFYVTSYKRHVQRSEDHVTVLVAKHDIPQGTSGADAAGMLSRIDVPRRSVVPGAISSPDQIANLVATQVTLQGQQVTTRTFSPVAESGVRAGLKGTLRAFQVQGDANQTLAGPAVGSKLTSGLQNNFSVLLAVTDQQAQKLLFVVSQTGSGSQGNGAGWSLQLRPVVHSADSPESVTTLDSVLRDGLSAGQVRRYRGVFGGGQ